MDQTDLVLSVVADGAKLVASGAALEGGKQLAKRTIEWLDASDLSGRAAAVLARARELAENAGGIKTRLSPGLATRIVHGSSKVDDDALQDMWANAVARALTAEIETSEAAWACAELEYMFGPEPFLLSFALHPAGRGLSVAPANLPPELASAVLRMSTRGLLHRDRGSQGAASRECPLPATLPAGHLRLPGPALPRKPLVRVLENLTLQLGEVLRSDPRAKASSAQRVVSQAISSVPPGQSSWFRIDGQKVSAWIKRANTFAALKSAGGAGDRPQPPTGLLSARCWQPEPLGQQFASLVSLAALPDLGPLDPVVAPADELRGQVDFIQSTIDRALGHAYGYR